MTWQRLTSRYHDFSALMDRGSAAVEEEDVAVLETLSRDSASLLAEIQAAWLELEAAARRRGEVDEAALEGLAEAMRAALAKSQANERRIAAWQARTQETICTVAQGGIALAGYGRPEAGGPELMTQRA